jgi:hypothetical protein
MRKVFQSLRLLGEKIFMPLGQLFFCVDFDTLRHCSHLIKSPGEYLPERVTCVHLHDLGLLLLGFSKRLSF